MCGVVLGCKHTYVGGKHKQYGTGDFPADYPPTVFTRLCIIIMMSLSSRITFVDLVVSLRFVSFSIMNTVLFLSLQRAVAGWTDKLISVADVRTGSEIFSQFFS